MASSTLQDNMLNKELVDFFTENHFGTLTTLVNGQIYATQVPFFIEKSNSGIYRIFSQVLVSNNVKNPIVQNNEVICIVQGPYTYISPSWLSEPGLPAWNHKTVQITGTLNILEGEAAWEVLQKKIDHFEQKMDKPLKINDLPYTLSSGNSEGVCVFEIRITDIEISFHLGQKYDDINFNRIIRELKKQDSYDAMLIAFEMEQQLKIRKRQQS